MKPQKQSRLYNVMFPIWFFFIYPPWTWLIILPVNFGVDSLVVLLGGRKLGVEDRKALWKKSILRVWLAGFACDILGALACFGVAFGMGALSLDWNLGFLPYGYVWEQIVSGIPGVLVAGVLLYLVNRFWSFRKTELTQEQIKKLALWLALFTAPYTMLIPLYF